MTGTVQSEVRVQTLRNYVGGDWVEPAATARQEVRNPATDEVVALVPLSDAGDVGAAVAAATAAPTSPASLSGTSATTSSVAGLRTSWRAVAAGSTQSPPT